MTDLLSVYKQHALALANKCNTLIGQIMRSNLSNRVKNVYISNAIRNYKDAISALKTKYMADILQQQQQQQIKKRKSLLVGINYIGNEPYQLSGCITDVESLNNKFGGMYNAEIMTDLTNKKPTRTAILSEFSLLLENANNNDVILFAFSGHGSYTADTNNDEQDRCDEMILSCDLRGVIDDDFKTIINQKLKAGVTLIALFDSCHSGTMLDLKYTYPTYEEGVSSNTTPDTAGTVILISGCMDNQTSAEALIADGKVSGAMTWSLLESLKSGSKLSWNALLTNMRNLLVNSGFNQIPQLSSGRPLDTTAVSLFC